MATYSKDDDLLPYALAGLVQRRDEIIAKIAEIRAQLAGEVIAAPVAGAKSAATKKRGKGKRVLSAEARERIAAAQRLRWAATRKGTLGKAAPAAKKAATKKRTLSPEARARIAEAQRKRWAAARKS
jgi:hypothetical protein